MASPHINRSNYQGTEENHCELLCASGLMGRSEAEVFVDLFNVVNNQGAIRLQDLASGSGTTKYLDEFVWQQPRNAFVGVRVKF